MIFAGTAQATGYLKLDGIDGESKRAKPAKVEKPRATLPPRTIPESHKTAAKPPQAGIIKKGKKREPSHTRGDEHEVEYDIAQ